MLKEIELADWEIGLIRNTLDRHRETLEGQAKVLDQCADSGGNPMITPDGARQLAGGKREQAKDLARLSRVFAECDSVWVQGGETKEYDSE